MSVDVSIIVDIKVCPATGFPEYNINLDKMLLELQTFNTVEINTICKVNNEMLQHCAAHRTILLVCVSNHKIDITPEEADRTGKVVSMTQEQYEDFFIDPLPFKHSNYVFVKSDVFEAIRKKYFK